MFESNLVKLQIIEGSMGATVGTLTISRSNNIEIPTPPLETQKQIVTKLDKLQEKTKALEAIYQQKITNLEELKKSILQKAFNGELIN